MVFLNNEGFYKFVCYHFGRKFPFHLYIPTCDLLTYLELLDIDVLKLGYKLKGIFNEETNNLKIIARSD
jgi:hypothetical protein